MRHRNLMRSRKSSNLNRLIDEEYTMSGSGGIAGDQLRTIVERIEQVEEEIKELAEAKKEIYQEAKATASK